MSEAARCCFGIMVEGRRCPARAVWLSTLDGRPCRGEQGVLAWCEEHRPPQFLSGSSHGYERIGWNCDLGDGQFDHDWQIVSDGDGEVIGGTRTWCLRRCRVCGEEDHQTEVTPADLSDDE